MVVEDMKDEIEAKFINSNHDSIRERLRNLGAVCEQPMRMMRRVVIHSFEMSKKNAFIRIRDEGYRCTMTYKQFDEDSVNGAKEYEITVSDFDEAVAILSQGGLTYDTYQESKRENWVLGDVEIMLDEWPWLNPYIEIEGPSEESVKETAERLGMDWNDAVYGGIANVYHIQYPSIGREGVQTINHGWSEIRFSDPIPPLLSELAD
jgi:adenylate cyclase class 2